MRLELRGITKRFPGVIANDAVDLVVEDQEIHGLLGENGAGKSTLMNILYGLYTADEGTVLLDGEPVQFDGPGDAIAAGIGMVHQHFMLVANFTVAENVMLGSEVMRAGRQIDRRTAEAQVAELAERHGLEVDPRAIVEDLPVGIQQRVEILKALYRDAQLLILDEPTAVLIPQEVEELFEAIRTLREAGRSIVFISHKLGEHRALADRISVLRRGRIVGTADPREASESELAELMVGRPVELTVQRDPASPGEPVLEVEHLSAVNPAGQVVVDDVTLTVHAGEIVGIAGVEGNGQTPLVRAVTALDPIVQGTVRLQGKDVTPMGRRELLRSGVGHVPQDRTGEGLVGDFTVAENLMLDLWNAPPYAERGRLRFDEIKRRARADVEQFDIRTPDVDTVVSTLSGGNQQKVVVAREFTGDNALLVCAQPTRGVDVGSIEYIHGTIVAQRDAGTAVLLVSSELDEVLALSDRIGVMYRGRLLGPFPTPIAKEAVGRMMAGADPQDVLGDTSEH